MAAVTPALPGGSPDTAAGSALTRPIPVSFVRFSIGALIATRAELPDIAKSLRPGAARCFRRHRGPPADDILKNSGHRVRWGGFGNYSAQYGNENSTGPMEVRVVFSLLPEARSSDLPTGPVSIFRC